MSRRTRAVIEVVLVYGLLGWVYVAAYAAAHPLDLAQHITAVLPLRRDTFGALAFAASAGAAIVLQAATGRVWERRRRRPTRGLARAELNTVMVYGLLAWSYLSINSLTHPWTIPMRLTHFEPWPSEGSTAVLSFAASAVAFFLLRSNGPADRPEDDDGHV